MKSSHLSESANPNLKLHASPSLSEPEKYWHSMQLANAIIDSSADAIITKTLNGIITSWNRAAERIFGYTADEVIGKPVTILFPPEHINEEPEIIRKIKNGEQLDHYETIRMRKDGSLVPISLTVSPIRNDNGEIIGASKIARDISAQKAYEQRLLKQASELEQFAYVASHDLKEPLRKIVIYADLLFKACKGQGGPEAERYTTVIDSAIKRMQALISDLLSYSRADRAEFPKETIDLNSALKEVLNDLFALVTETSAQITYDVLPSVTASAFQIHQLFQNLISNAIKFRSDKIPQIHISAKSDGDFVTVSVRDNGMGLDTKYKEQIFRVFQRLHSSSKYEGTGIGLAICKKVVEQNGGKIWVESSLGQGATFFFSLPAGKEGSGS